MERLAVVFVVDVPVADGDLAPVSEHVDGGAGAEELVLPGQAAPDGRRGGRGRRAAARRARQAAPAHHAAPPPRPAQTRRRLAPRRRLALARHLPGPAHLQRHLSRLLLRRRLLLRPDRRRRRRRLGQCRGKPFCSVFFVSLYSFCGRPRGSFVDVDGVGNHLEDVVVVWCRCSRDRCATWWRT